MNRLIAVMLFAALGANGAFAQQKVEASGITAEVTFEPGALLGPHHHAGPGLRYIVSGELTFIQAGKAHVYKAGDYFFESGDVVQWSGPSMIQPKPH